jgi:SAM-dependent methyltransferase
MKEVAHTNQSIDLLFGGMEKLAPGGNVHTLNVLHLLPKQQFEVIVDAGCGTGRQTLALARELDTLVNAIDRYQPFLNDLIRRAQSAQIADLIRVHCLDIQDIPSAFPHIDLLWSEGAAYNIGFANALTIWAGAIDRDGFAVVSELSWLREPAPTPVATFFSSCYPDMKSIDQNLVLAETAGYRVLTTYTLPQAAWIEDYYDVLEPRAQALVSHPDSSVRDLAIATLQEIEIFNCSENSYGYVFYLLQRV